MNKLKLKRIVAGAMSMAITVTMISGFANLTAFAQDQTSSSVVQSSISQEDAAAKNTAAEAATASSQSASVSPSSSENTPQATAQAYVANYQVVDLNGNPMAAVRPGDKVIIAVTIIDERVKAADFAIAPETYTARVHTTMSQGAFTINDTNNIRAKVRQGVQVTGTSGTPYEALCYVLEFRDVVYQGGAPTFSFGISYTGYEGSDPYKDNNVPMPYPYTTLDISVTQATDDIPAPTIILNSANYGKVATIGERFTLSTVATNTSELLELDNVSLKITLPTGITLASGNSQILIGNVGKKGAVKHDFVLVAEGVANDVTSLPVKLTYTFEAFVGGKRTAFTSEQDISINVQQPTRFAISGVDFSQEFYANQDGYLTAKLVNKGKTTVYNVTAEIVSESLQGAQVQFVGNVAPGSTSEAEFDFTSAAAGEAKGKLVITYEDASGTQSTLTSDFSMQVLEEMPMNPDMEQPIVNPEEPKKSPTPFIIGGVVLVAGAGGAIYFIKKKKQKKEIEEEDEDI